jgi:hypothetical protein
MNAINDWRDSVYYAESNVRCSLEAAWKVLLDYQRWNPHFDGATITPVQGRADREGGLVLIQDKDPYIPGEPPPKFLALTVKVVPQRNVVWCVYPQSGAAFRNFVDFSLTQCAGGVQFSVRYYEQLAIADDLLAGHRQQSDEIYQRLALSFKNYCETQLPATGSREPAGV